MPTQSDVDLLNNATKLVSASAERGAAYRRVVAEYEAVHPPLRPLVAPVGPLKLRPSRLSSAAEWNGQGVADNGDEVFTDPSLSSYVVVSGGAGAVASKQAGLASVFAERLNLTKGVLSSGGAIAWIPALVGMSAADIRNMNAGVPSNELLRDIPGSTAADKLVGAKEMSRLRQWFHQWMVHAGTPTFGDVKFPEGHPLPVPGPYKDTDGNWRSRPADPYRISIGVSVWAPEKCFPLMTQEELDDPHTVQKLLKQVYRSERPFRNVRQRFFPNDVADELPWLKDSVDQMEIADVVHMSSSRYPWSIPKLLQNPETGRLKVHFDGASLHTHPELWAAGFQPIWDTHDPMKVLVMRGKRSDRRLAPQSAIDSAEKPWLSNYRSAPVKGLGPLDLHNLTVEERDAMFLAGVAEAEAEIVQLVVREASRLDDGIFKADDTGRIAPRDPLHGANQILMQPTTRVSEGPPSIGW